jgi:uncharacterized membrane protein SpoIIM required for sporulation
MKQVDFEARYEPLWVRFEAALATREGHNLRRPATDPSTDSDATLQAELIPQAYRQVCQHLALSRSRNYSPRLEARLNRLALLGHRHLYARDAGSAVGLVNFFARDFPACVRRNGGFVAIMALLFYVPLFGMIIAIWLDPALAGAVLSPNELAEMEGMYDPAAERIGARDSGDDFLMFGFYVMHNIGIGFRTFASGLLFGLGAVYVILFNGVTLGAVIGHLSANGFGQTLWPFIAGHGAFELNAIVLAGAAGLKLGYSLLAPGRRRRAEALRVSALEAMPIVYGFTAMLLGAAFIEAFWSSTTWAPSSLKYAVGAVTWLLVIVYFATAGRVRGS